MPELDPAQLLHQAVDPLRREVAAVQELLERERRLQREATAHLMAPVDVVFELLEESASTMQRQAEALEAAGAALAETAALVRRQGELFERTVATVHRPWRAVASVAGVRAGEAPGADDDGSAPPDEEPEDHAPPPRGAARTSTRKRTSRSSGKA